jgi:hypothetical protein
MLPEPLGLSQIRAIAVLRLPVAYSEFEVEVAINQ